MYFQISPVTKNTRKVVKKKNDDDEEPAVLVLAPFTPNPKIIFDKVVVPHKATRKLLIKNPSNEAINLSLSSKSASENLDIVFSWYDMEIKGKETDVLEIEWNATIPGAWRFAFWLISGSGTKWNVPIVFKSVAPQKQGKHAAKKNKHVPPLTCTLKKRTSPNRTTTKRRITPPRIVLPDITNVPRISINGSLAHDGKENNSNLFLSSNTVTFDPAPTEIITRRSTFVINNGVPELPSTPAVVFNDSLEKDWFHSVTSKSICNSSSPVTTSYMYTPCQQFQPFVCSTEEKSLSIVNKLSIDGKTCKTSLFVNNAQQELQKTNAELLLADPSVHNAKKPSNSTKVYLNDISYTNNAIGNSTFVKEGPMTNTSSIRLSPIAVSEHITSAQNCYNEHFSGDQMKSLIQEPIIHMNKQRIVEHLHCIEEESINASNKRKSSVLFDLTPAKRRNLHDVTDRMTTWSKRPTPIKKLHSYNYCLTPSYSIQKSFGTKTISDQSSFRMNIPNTFYIFATSDAVDPFINCENDNWLQKQEQIFKQWLNVLLTPPVELHADDSQAIDIALLWQKCNRGDKIAHITQTKEMMSNNYHTRNKLDFLRRNASRLYLDPKIQAVKVMITKCIDSGKLTMRNDKQIHLDTGLQSEILSVLLSYNPLWLRIGLETIYKTAIQMSSNSDVTGLTLFLMDSVFRHQTLMKKYKSVHHPKFTSENDRLVLQQFFMLVYFLDHAKCSKLIPHDPCLFSKRSEIKDSQTVLVRFARELLHGIGDVTRVLRSKNYVVSHKQTYINEFDYAIKLLGVDLRDGVRLTRLMEIILLRSNLSDGLRVPAISRLQKIHNVKMVFDALIQSGFEFVSPIEPRDIVDGYREKTMSFLWQVIFKFHSPLLTEKACLIQKWWRSKNVVEKRLKLREQHTKRKDAVLSIEKWYKRQKIASKFLLLADFCKMHKEDIIRNRAAVKIQSIVRMYNCRKHFLITLYATIKIQSVWRMVLLSRLYKKLREAAIIVQKRVRGCIARRRFLKLKYYTLLIEQRYLARKVMLKDKQRYEQIKCATQIIQQYFRAYKEMKKCHINYLTLYQTTVTIQIRFRAKKRMQLERSGYLQLKNAVNLMQRRFRANKLAKDVRSQYQILRKSVITIQTHFRATQSMIQEKGYFGNLRRSIVIVQRRFRAKLLMRKMRSNYLRLKWAVHYTEEQRKSLLLMRQHRNIYIEKRDAIIKIQRYYRAYILQKKCRTRYQSLLKSTIHIQRRFRANKEMNLQRTSYMQYRNAVILIQNVFRAKLLMRKERTNYDRLKRATIFIQRRVRTKKIMKTRMYHYSIMRHSIIIIQQQFRAYKLMQKTRLEYIQLRQHAIFVQRQVRANRKCYIAREEFLRLKNAVQVVQQCYRARLLMKSERNDYLQMKNAVITIQKRFRTYKLTVELRGVFLKKKTAAILIQQKYRALILMRIEVHTFVSLKNATVCIQRRLRANTRMKNDRSEFLRHKNVIIKIQNWYRSCKMVDRCRTDFLLLKSVTIQLQRRFRATKVMRSQMDHYNNLKQSTRIIERAYLNYKKRKITIIQNRAAVVLQKYVRGFIVRKMYANLFSEEEKQKRLERKIRNAAAIKIQAMWRGCWIRSQNSENMQLIRQHCMSTYKKIIPENRIGYRCEAAALQILDAKFVPSAQNLHLLHNIEYATRRLKHVCERLSDVLTDKLYIIIITSNQSFTGTLACTLATDILINFSKYFESISNSWRPEYMDKLLSVMKNYCDKDTITFPILCTLLWVYANNSRYRRVLLAIPNIQHRMLRMKQACLRKENMMQRITLKKTSSTFLRSNQHILPSLIADWGYEINGRPKNFTNAVFALNSLMSVLGFT